MNDKKTETPSLLSWSAPRTYDFNQIVLPASDYQDLCSLHILLKKVNDSLYRIQTGLTSDATKDELSEAAYESAVEGQVKSSEPMLLVMAWLNNVLDGYYPPTKGDMDACQHLILLITKSVHKLEIVHDVQVNELGTKSTLHLTVLPATFKILYTDLKESEKQILTMIGKFQ